jgi:hypothetical protein
MNNKFRTQISPGPKDLSKRRVESELEPNLEDTDLKKEFFFTKLDLMILGVISPAYIFIDFDSHPVDKKENF